MSASRLVTAVAGAAVGAIVLAGCGGSGEKTAVGPTTSVAPPTSLGAKATTSSVSPNPANPEALARGLFAAWKAGDRAAAAQVATAGAITEIFSRPFQQVHTSTGPADPYIFKDCQVQTAGVAASCTFTGQDATLEMQLGVTGGGPLRVVSVRFDQTGIH